MKLPQRMFYFLSFVGLAVVAALALNRVAESSFATDLLRAAALAVLCTAPGLIHRRLWPLALVLLPVGCYLLLRTTMPLPPAIAGAVGQYHFYLEQLQLGASAYKVTVFPLDVQGLPELRLLLAFSAYWLLGSAGFLALCLRHSLPAVVLVMILVGYSLTVDAASRALWPGLLFLLFAAALMTAARALERTKWRPREALVGVAVAVLAVAFSLGVLTAAPAVVATPWQDWRAWDPFKQSQATYSFNWFENYPALLDPANKAPVMQVRSPYPCYWRANALDSFTGSTWLASRAFPVQLQSKRENTGGAGQLHTYAVPPESPSPPGLTVVEEFFTDSLYTNYLFVGGEPISITSDRELPLRTNDLRALRVSTAVGPSFRYTVTASIPQIKPADLVGLGRDYPPEPAGCLLLPFPRADELAGPDKSATWQEKVKEDQSNGWEWAGLYDLNQRIVGDATDPYQVTLRIEQHLRGSYSYSLYPPGSDYSSPYAAFLFDTRTGYCQHFAGAMALLLRFNGIPARVAVGFTSGEKLGDGLYQVSTNNAHAWVEVYFPTVGWVAFDPTPGRNLPLPGASSTTPAFANPFLDTPPAEGEPVTTLPPSSARPEGERPTPTTEPGDENAWYARAPWLIGLAVLLAVLATWPLTQDLWHSRKLHWGRPEKRLQTSIRLLRANLARYGVPAAPGHTYEELLELAHDYLGLDYDPSLPDRVQAVLFGGASATPDDLRRAEATRKQARSLLLKLYRHQALPQADFPRLPSA